MAHRLTHDAALAQLAALERERRAVDALARIEVRDLDDVLAQICRLTVELTPCDRATVFLHSPRAGGFLPFADHGTPPRVLERLAGRHLSSWVHAAGERVALPWGRSGRVTRDEATPEMLAILDALEQHAVCVVPLRSTTCGAILVSVGGPPGFDEATVRMLHGVGHQASNLIDHARTFEKLQRSARVRAGLATLAAAVNAATDRARIADLVSAETAALFDIDVAAVLLREGDGLVVAGQYGLTGAPRRLPLGSETEALTRALRDRVVAFENDLTTGPMARGPLALDLGLESVLAVPLGGRAALGCLLLGSTRRRHVFSREIADDTLVLSLIATAALERAALFKKLDAARHTSVAGR